LGAGSANGSALGASSSAFAVAPASKSDRATATAERVFRFSTSSTSFLRNFV
jgi:hypothetical protein